MKKTGNKDCKVQNAEYKSINYSCYFIELFLMIMLIKSKKYVKYLRIYIFFQLGVKYIFVIKNHLFQLMENIMYITITLRQKG